MYKRQLEETLQYGQQEARIAKMAEQTGHLETVNGALKRGENLQRVITDEMCIRDRQGVMLIFAVVLFLIDIENFRLGKYVIGIVTLVVGIVSVTAVFVIRRFQKVVLCLLYTS